MGMTNEEKMQKQRDAQRKYNATHDKVTVRLEGGTCDKIKSLGYSSVNSFIVKVVKEAIEKEEKAHKK